VGVERTWRRTRPWIGRAEAERWPRSAATRRSRFPAWSSIGTTGGAREEVGEAAMVGNRTPAGVVIYWRRVCVGQVTQLKKASPINGIRID